MLAVKILCVLLSHFPLRCEVLKRPALEDRPAVVTHAVGSQRLVLDYSPETPCLHYGMTLQQALSLCGEAEIISADIPRYWAIFNSILDSFEKKSPLVEAADLGCAYLGLDGMHLIYKDDEAVVNAVKEVIPESFKAQFGIAEGKFLSYLLASNCPPGEYQALTGSVRSFLKDLPCNTLPVSEKSKQKLSEFGLHTLGQIAVLELGPLLSQFGPEGKRMWELTRGHDDTPLYPRCSEELIEESVMLPSVTVSLESILVAVESLLSRVFVRSSLKGRGITRLALWVSILGSEYWEKTIKFKEPAMNAGKAVSRIKQMLESSPLPGPVEELGIKITGLGYSSGRQKNLFTEVRAKDQLLDDIKQLEFRLGGPQVFKVKDLEPWSRIPERRRALIPISQ